MKKTTIVIVALSILLIFSILMIFGVRTYEKNKCKNNVNEINHLNHLVDKRDRQIDSLKKSLAYVNDLAEECLGKGEHHYFYYYDFNNRRYYCFSGRVIVKEFINGKPPELFENWTEDVELSSY